MRSVRVHVYHSESHSSVVGAGAEVAGCGSGVLGVAAGSDVAAAGVMVVLLVAGVL